MRSTDSLTKAFEATEVNLTPGERSDVAWITTDTVDLDGEVIVSKGIDLTQFLKNPVVMVSHNYKTWPIGTCAWIKAAKTPGFNGLTAKTMWDDDPDAVKLFGMTQRGLVRGRSIGVKPPPDLRPGEWGPPTAEELKIRPDWAKARAIIRRCVLFEYSVCPIPVNSDALVISVTKAAGELGLELPDFLKAAAEPAPIPSQVPAPTAAPTFVLPAYRTLDQVQAGLLAALSKSFDPGRLASDAARAALDRARGAI